MMGPFQALFYQGSQEISLPGSNWESIFGSMKVQEGLLSLGRVGQLPNKSSNMVRRAREYKEIGIPIFSQKFQNFSQKL